MLITFTSLWEWVDKGFFAKIQYVPFEDSDSLATFCTVSNPCKVNEGHCYHNQQCFKGLKCGNNNCPVALGYANDTNCCYEHCNEWLDLDNGILTSPNYPNNYDVHTECTWVINASQGQILTLLFHDFEVDCYNLSNLLPQYHTYYVISCSFHVQLNGGLYYGFHADYLRIFDGNEYGKKFLMSQLTGSNVPLNVPFVSSFSSAMLIVFDSDFKDNLKGFNATIIITERSNYTNNSSNVCTVSNPCVISEGHCHYDGQCKGSLRCGVNNCLQEAGYVNGTNCCYDYCEQFLDLATGILDYYHPEHHGDMEYCTWSIHVANNMTITLEPLELQVICQVEIVYLETLSVIKVNYLFLSLMRGGPMIVLEFLMVTNQLETNC